MSNLSIRLQQARKAAGLSLRALADLVHLSHAAIKKYEDGDVCPSSDILIKLAKALQVQVEFFFRPIKVSLGDVQFRKRSNRKAEEAIKFKVFCQIERRLELDNLYPSSPIAPFELPNDLPEKIYNFEEIESFAEKLRDHWRLGLAPIHDLIDAFENHGVRVVVIDADIEHGLSTMINGQLIIVIDSKWPGDQQRFNLAYELAHYIFINRLSSTLDLSQVCHRFAGAFLFPRAAVFQAVGKVRRGVEWQELLLLKQQFQLSLGAICYRLKDLGVIGQSYYKNLMMSFRQKGWHRQEPGIPSVKAHIFNQKVFQALGEDYIGESKAAELLSCSLTQLKALRQVQNAYE